jgi:hypothetical protein
MAYTTALALREYKDIASSADDALLTDLIASAQKQIDNYCHRTFEASADSTRYFDYSTDNIDWLTLWLDEDLCAITTVTNGDSVVVASDEYTTIPRNETPYNRLRILSNSGKYWTYTDEWMDAISITGRWAYSETAPDDIAQACTRLAAFLYKQRDAQLFDVTAIEAGTVLTPVGIPSDVRTMLAPYIKR